jgi:alpha-D-ribose 1-methylphosphonate 5-phosphate C-P lyase
MKATLNRKAINQLEKEAYFAQDRGDYKLAKEKREEAERLKVVPEPPKKITQAIKKRHFVRRVPKVNQSNGTWQSSIMQNNDDEGNGDRH